jgi:hypothetical protein
VTEAPKLIRRADAAERLAVSVNTVIRWGATGRLDERKVGPAAVRVTEASVDALVRAGARKPGKASETWPRARSGPRGQPATPAGHAEPAAA